MLFGCGGGSSPAVAAARTTRSVKLIPIVDPWPLAYQRFMDIDDTPFSAEFERTFSYRRARVSLSYDSAPQTAFFSGKISARGLKPNFAYQIKLVGKPVFGARGWKSAGDDFANEALGRAGRWWKDFNVTTRTNNADEVFEQLYQTPPDAEKATVYGYLFLGIVVTDQKGRAEQIFSGDESYHITWQDKQSGSKDVIAGDYPVQSSAPFYGYGAPITPKTVRLWHEYEAGRPAPVRLPDGDYNCRLLLTEETLHNSDFEGKGGFWRTVLGTEGFDRRGRPDRNPSNDVRFRIGAAKP